MDFKEMSDDLLKDIFVHLDFAHQQRLGRCAHTWWLLLNSNYVLRTSTLENTTTRMLLQSAPSKFPTIHQLMEDAVEEVRHQVHTVICSGANTLTSTDNARIRKHWPETLDSHFQFTYYTGDQFTQQVGISSGWHTILGMLTAAHPSASGKKWFHVVFIHMPRMPVKLVLQLWNTRDAFASMELRDVSLRVCDMFGYLQSMWPDEGPEPWLKRLCSTLQWHGDYESTRKNVVVVKGPMVWYRTNAKGKFTRQWILDLLPSPYEKEMKEMQAKMQTVEPDKVRKAVQLILAEFLPDVSVSGETALEPLDDAHFHPIVLWLLFAWKGHSEPQ